MKFAIFSLLPLLVAAAAVVDRDANVMSNEPQTVNVKDFAAGTKLDVLELKTQKGEFSAQVSCPPGYPKYCPRYNFCCPAQAQACCPRACCRSAGGFCGSDGLCYIWA